MILKIVTVRRDGKDVYKNQVGILSPVMILPSLPFLIFKDLYQGFEIRFHFFKNVLCFMYSGPPKRITENCMYGVYLHVTAGTLKNNGG